jgi:hypothetical protein
MTLSLAVQLQARIIDELTSEALCTSYALIDPTATHSDILTLWGDWLAAVDAAIDGQIIAASYTVTPALPSGLKSAAVSGSRVEQTGVLNFVATGSTQRYGQALPALSNSSSVVSGGRIVLTSGQPIPLLIAVLTGVTTNLEYTNEVQQPLVSLKDTLITFRVHHRQLAAASYERA